MALRESHILYLESETKQNLWCHQKKMSCRVVIWVVFPKIFYGKYCKDIAAEPTEWEDNYWSNILFYSTLKHTLLLKVKQWHITSLESSIRKRKVCFASIQQWENFYRNWKPSNIFQTLFSVTVWLILIKMTSPEDKNSSSTYSLLWKIKQWLNFLYKLHILRNYLSFFILHIIF